LKYFYVVPVGAKSSYVVPVGAFCVRADEEREFLAHQISPCSFPP
jgi:hypothetical protein